MSASLHQWAVEQLAALNVKVTRLVTDSRAIQRGDTFVAYPGEKSDGRQFIANAIQNGANAVIYETLLSGHPGDAHRFAWNEAWQVPRLGVADLRHRAGWLADAVYGKPSENLWTVGITGTNGKTSTSHWIAHALSEAGKRCAVIGTLGNGFIGGNGQDAGLQADRKHHAGRGPRAWTAGRLSARGCAIHRNGSVIACAVPGAGECGALRCRNAHQSEPRSSRLPR